ncbi:MAG: cysteine desulfurase family protein [Bacillota bacterium]|nr:cysteine desulfurase family protein [Bacillota bacterium]
MTYIYLDNSATTAPYPEVIRLTSAVMKEIYGNPSSMHSLGVAAEKTIAKARRRIASVIGVRDKEIIFTSGGTEANNLAIIGSARRNRNRGNHLITSQTEHPSVLNCCRQLEKEGFRVSYIPVDKKGVVNPETLGKLIGEETILVSIMHVNNEIGTIEPLTEIGNIVKERNRSTILHIDAVQSFTKVPVKFRQWQADLISFSSHKIHGPRGAGCLWIREGLLLEPVIYGGGQEKNLRSGTENTAAIAGFGLAAELSARANVENDGFLISLKLSFLEELKKSGLDFHINGPDPEVGAPHILNLAFPGLNAEVLLHSLEAKGLYVSAGSACHSKHPEPSHVLSAIGLDHKLLTGSLRFSFSGMNRAVEIKKAAIITADTASELYKMF